MKRQYMVKIFFPVIAIIILSSGYGKPAYTQDLLSFSTSLFAGSGNCQFCHMAGTGVLTFQDQDISPPNGWRATMMANASRDPLWQAKVSAEASYFPQLGEAIEDKCSPCHAPMGRTQVLKDGGYGYDIDMLNNDPTGLDGVSCTLCHQIDAKNLGTPESFSAGYTITDNRLIYGPYQNPVTAQMQMNMNYTPYYSSHIEESALCGTCHTLFTAHVDESGELVGRFPEQTPYLEWLNSVYPTDGQSCQYCHMKSVSEPMKISVRPPSLNTFRSPVWRHQFAGGNMLLPAILRDNSTELRVTADSQHFNTILDETRSILDTAITLTTDVTSTAEEVDIMVKIENNAGHKFPSGFPSRRAWIHVTVRNTIEEVVFESGSWDEASGQLTYDTPQEHHQLITTADKTQIYEAVMSDANGMPTRVLLLAAYYAKDNRVPPKGFGRTIDGYEDIAIVGAAAFDEDFNAEESGSDMVHFRIPHDGLESGGTVDVEILYETVPSIWLEEIEASATVAGERFMRLYEASDRSPVRITSTSHEIVVTGVDNSEQAPTGFHLGNNHPNPFNPMTTIPFTISEKFHVTVNIFDIQGRLVDTLVNNTLPPGRHEAIWDGSGHASGVYLCRIQTGTEHRVGKMLMVK
jgi:hypothetical protein